ncbi:S23-interacting protein [Homalodisca vitripennis]|nr:S23-interacting protein [Homalodisca vitripennis]
MRNDRTDRLACHSATGVVYWREEEIEADSFLGQDPQSGSNSFKQFALSRPSIGKSFSSQSLASVGHSEPLTPDLRTQFPSEPQLPLPNPSPIPEFTQSFTGVSHPTKPTPVYADALSQQFTPLSIHSHTSSDVVQPPPSLNTVQNSQFSGQIPTFYTPSPEAPVAPQQQSLFSYFSTLEPPQYNTPPAVGNVTPSAAITPPVSHPPQRPPEATLPPPSGGQQNSYRLGNIKRPTYTRPPELPVAVPPMAAMPTPLAPTQAPATLFTPCSVDSLGSSGATATVPQTFLKFSEMTPSSASPSPPSVLPPSFASLAQGATYRPVYHHWFYKKMVEGKVLWQPFSMSDSLALEEAFTSATISPDTKVATDGGRYDVEVLRRRRSAAYWAEEPSEVRRCSWFVKGSLDIRYVPYEENVATMLEEEYRIASTTNEWNRHVPLPDGEVIVIHSPNAIAHHTRSVSPDVWGTNSPQMQQKPRVVKRGMDEFDISDGEPEKVDHLLFLVHGIGKFCDLKFRPVTEVGTIFETVESVKEKAEFMRRIMEHDLQHCYGQSKIHMELCRDQGGECIEGSGFCSIAGNEIAPPPPPQVWIKSVYTLYILHSMDDFRNVSLQLLHSHFKEAVEMGRAGRVEVLPVSWHQALHNENIDKRLNNITLQSIPRLRHFTNDTLLDILFYTSPVFCETIVQAVGSELNRLYNLFLSRNPSFCGGVSLGGHSLGSLILFDMLCHQMPVSTPSPAPTPTTPTPTNDGLMYKGYLESKERFHLMPPIAYRVLMLDTSVSVQP